MNSSSRLAGGLIFVGAGEFLAGMIIAESFYPGYSVSQNFISDLGATCRSSGPCQIFQPASAIFNTSVSLFGLLTIIGALFLWRAYKDKILVPIVALAGIGVLGVGLFPETTGVVHGLLSFIAFLFGGVSAIVAYKIERPPFSYISVIIGAITLVALGLYVSKQYSGLGPGGMERMIAYPALIFALGFGGHLMARIQEGPT